MENNLQRNSRLSLLKCFSEKQKIPLIPQLLHKNKLVTNFLEKAEISNEIFHSFFPK